MEFGYVLKTLRIEAGIGLRELARMIDISPSYLSMIENRQQPPPTPARIEQIEQALNVPKGYLLSLANDLEPDLIAFIDEVPEILDFLRVARHKRMKPRDFVQLTALLNGHGLKGLNLAIKNAMSDNGASQEFPPNRALGPYIWPYLSEKLICDVQGIKSKPAFLEHAASTIAHQVQGLDAASLLEGLLKREEIASTGIGHGIAVPHAYAAGADAMVVALFRLPEGLDFDAIDEEPVHLVFVLTGPHSAEFLHLKLLARLARLFNHTALYRKILKASSHREIISAFKTAEMGIP